MEHLKQSFWVIKQKGEFKTGVKRKQSMSNLPKNELFLLPHTYTCVCVSGSKKCSFSEKLGRFVFLQHTFWDSPFCLITVELCSELALGLLPFRRWLRGLVWLWKVQSSGFPEYLFNWIPPSWHCYIARIFKNLFILE